MKQLLPLILSVLLLASCGTDDTPTKPGHPSGNGPATSVPSTPVINYDPDPVEGEPSEELLLQVFNGHPRLAGVDPIAVMVSEDGEDDVLGVVLFEDPEALIDEPYALAAVTRDRVIALNTRDCPEHFVGIPSEIAYQGDGLCTFAFTASESGTVYDVSLSLKVMGSELMPTMTFVARDGSGDTQG